MVLNPPYRRQPRVRPDLSKEEMSNGLDAGYVARTMLVTWWCLAEGRQVDGTGAGATLAGNCDPERSLGRACVHVVARGC